MRALSPQLHQTERTERLPVDDKLMDVTIWACPTPGCGSYYAAPSADDLTKRYNRRSSMSNLADEDPAEWSRIVSTRSECPHCRTRGDKVDRVPISVTIRVPVPSDVAAAA